MNDNDVFSVNDLCELLETTDLLLNNPFQQNEISQKIEQSNDDGIILKKDNEFCDSEVQIIPKQVVTTDNGELLTVGDIEMGLKNIDYIQSRRLTWISLLIKDLCIVKEVVGEPVIENGEKVFVARKTENKILNISFGPYPSKESFFQLNPLNRILLSNSNDFISLISCGLIQKTNKMAYDNAYNCISSNNAHEKEELLNKLLNVLASYKIKNEFETAISNMQNIDISDKIKVASKIIRKIKLIKRIDK